MNSSKNITVQFSCVQAAYWMGFACVSAFSSVYLLSIGISNSLIGLTLSLGALASAIIQPYVGMLIDYNPKITTKSVLLFTAVIMTVLALLLYPVSQGVPAIIPLMYGFLMLLLQLAQPFSNSIGMAAINAGYTLHFGPARAIGSLGYALVAFVLGKVAASKGGGIVPAFIALSFILVIITLMFFPLKENSETIIKENSEAMKDNLEESGNSKDLGGLLNNGSKTEELRSEELVIKESEVEKSNKKGVMAFFSKYKALGIMVIGLVLIFFSHVILNSFGLQIIVSKGGSSESMGIATAISASIEVVPMFLFPILKKKFKVSSLLKVAAVFFTLKIIFTLFAPNVPIYYAVQSCQMLGWGIMAVSIVYYVNDLVDVEDTAQGQAYSGMALTIGNVLGNLVGGRVIDSFGINTLLAAGSIAAIIGSIIFFAGVNLSKVSMHNN